MKWKDEYKKTFQSNYGLCIKYKNQQIIEKRKIFKKKQKNKQRNKKTNKETKTASSPGQDLYPDWDRIRGLMLYPLSCGELTMIKK